jgi:hypothetical protein
MIKNYLNKEINIPFGSLKLPIIALFTALILCGSETTIFGTRIALNKDTINFLKLTAGAVDELLKGQFLLRVTDNLTGDSANPYFQFYSPAVFYITSIFALLSFDLSTGFTTAVVFMTIISFIYAYKLSKYLTLSSIYGYVGAFVYVTGPYLYVNRVLRGSYAEYFAMCLLPLVVYYHMRLMATFSLKNWIGAIFSSSILFLTHFITTCYVIFFYSIFFMYYLINCIVIFKKSKKNFFKKYIRRLLALCSVLLAVLIIDGYYLIPAVLIDNLNVKKLYIYDLRFSMAFVPILSFFSITDMIWSVSSNNDAVRIQIGLTYLCGMMAFIYLRFRDWISPLIWPLWLTATSIIFLVLMPIIFIGPLKYIEIAQNSYRFMAQFTIIATIIFVLSLKSYIDKNNIVDKNIKKIISLVIIITSLILVKPYLYPKEFKPFFPYKVNDTFIKQTRGLEYANVNYLFFNSGEGLVLIDDNDLIKPAIKKNSSDRTYLIDLNKMAKEEKWENSILLDVLYYPDLQKIDITIDEKKISPIIETFWCKRNGFGHDKGEIGNFHGMKIIGLPDSGLLKVRVRFVGSYFGNLLSITGLIVLLVLILIIKIKKRTSFLRIKKIKLNCFEA